MLDLCEELGQAVGLVEGRHGHSYARPPHAWGTYRVAGCADVACQIPTIGTQAAGNDTVGFRSGGRSVADTAQTGRPAPGGGATLASAAATVRTRRLPSPIAAAAASGP